MPQAPKSKQSSHVLVWNRGRTDNNGHFRAGNVIINYLDKGADDRPVPVIHPITVGLTRVPRSKWARQIEDAKRVGDGHMFSKALASGRLQEIDLFKMPDAEWREALDQTADKSLLSDLAEGKEKAPAKVQEYVADLLANWNREDISRTRNITRHFASFSRAS